MTDDAVFCAAFAPNPVGDAARLIYADYLDEHDRHVDAARQRVLADPDDDGKRLVFADAVERTDAALAEFVRVQVELALTPERTNLTKEVDQLQWVDFGREFGSDAWFVLTDPENRRGVVRYRGQNPRWAELRRRERELWEKVGCNGVPLGIGSLQVTWVRGFVEKLEVSAKAWLTHADAICAKHPIREVRLTDFPEIEYSQWPVSQARSIRGIGPRERISSLAVSCRIAGLTWREIPDGANSHGVVSVLLASEFPGITFHLPEPDADTSVGAADEYLSYP